MAFQSKVDGNRDIIGMYANGMGQKNVTDHQADGWDVAWSTR